MSEDIKCVKIDISMKKEFFMETKIIELKKTILEDNDVDANILRKELKEKRILYVNIMSSPGAGKTSLLKQTITVLKDKIKMAVMEADIDSDVDTKTILQTGIPAIQLHTGGMCHLDADMSRQGLKELSSIDIELVFLENVGNLVCPAEFDTGAIYNIAILSVPEGDDKPLKYPLMFEVCDVVLINKIDTLPVFDFDINKAKEAILQRNAQAHIFPLSALTGEGIGSWTQWLEDKVKDWKEG